VYLKTVFERKKETGRCESNTSQERLVARWQRGETNFGSRSMRGSVVTYAESSGYAIAALVEVGRD
jgi:hypothetical protein